MPEQLEQFRFRATFAQNRLVIPVGLLSTTLKVGDRRPFFRAQLYDPQGNAMNLTGLTVVFRMRPKLNRRALTIDDQSMNVIAPATDGIVEYQWASADTDEEGEFDAWVVVDHGSSVLESFPNCGSHSVRVEQ